MSDTSTAQRWTLYDLPFAARLTIAAFLISVAIGYFSALVQVHFQHASGGNPLPTDEDMIRHFHGKKGESVLERLIRAPESEPFSSSGSMRQAFTTQSVGWESAIQDVAGAIDELPEDQQKEKLRQAEVRLRRERDGEALLMAHWVKTGLDKKAYEDNAYPIPSELSDQPVSKKYVEKLENGSKVVKLRTLFANRCIRCHKDGRQAGDAPLDTYERIKVYARAEMNQGMPLRKLAQTTHVHLLGFSMLYGLTGALFALTAFPGLLRVVLAPLPLVAQVIDIAFWWLARADEPYGPMFARAIPISGMVVAGGLGLHILLTLFALFGRFGKMLLVVFIAAAIGGGLGIKQQVIDPFLARQPVNSEARQ